MALSTFAELKASITTWMMRDGDTDFEARTPDFVALCESRCNRILRTREMEAVAPLTLDASGEASLPADYIAFRDVVALGYSPTRLLGVVSPDYAIDEHPFDGAEPEHFSIAGSTLRTHPKGAGTVRLRYFQKIPALSDANTSNWLLAKAPDVYLYGSLLEAAPFMRDDERIQTFGTYFDKAVEGLKSEDHHSRYYRGQVRSRGATP